MVQKVAEVDVEEPPAELVEHVVARVAVSDAESVGGHALAC